MRAMILPALCRLDENLNPLQLVELPDPEPGPGEILVRVSACGVCHTELDEIEGRTPPPALPVVLGHQVVGRVVARGPEVGPQSSGLRYGLGARSAWRGFTRPAGRARTAARAVRTCAPSFAPPAAMRTAAMLS